MNDIEKIAKLIGRIIAVLINRNIITQDEALYILEPLKNVGGEKK